MLTKCKTSLHKYLHKYLKEFPELWNPLSNHLSLFILILIPNLTAALLEGLSFALMLGAISVLSSEPIPPFMSQFFKGIDPSKLFLTLMILSVLCQGIRSAFTGIALYVNTLLSFRIQEESQLKIYRKIFNLSYRCICGYKIGDLAEYTKIPPIIINVILDNANKLIVSCLMVLSTLTIMFLLNVKLALLTLLLLGLTGGLHKAIIKKIGRASEKLSDSVVECSKQTIQSLQSIRTIHTYNRQEYIHQKIHQILDKTIPVSKKVYFWNNFIPSINELLGVFFVTSILITGIWILDGGALSVLITFIALTHRLAIRIQYGNIALGAILTQKGSILRLEEILSDHGKEFAPTTGIPFPGLKNEIKLEHVELQYQSSDKPAIHKISLLIPKGKTIALVGASGAGKSSILDLLLRLYEPTQGKILIDGKNLKEFSIGTWRDHLGVVSQDTAIFNDTIEENIRFGLPETTKVKQAAELAGFDEFVQTLPDGYQTIVGERGIRLSGGQKQRLALSRALIRNPEILILDEATSNLDSQSEYLIQCALEKLQGNRTILIVAHRLSTIMNADHIYVLDKGEVLEEGNHPSLLNKGGKYAKFWQRQASVCEVSVSP